MSYTYDKLKYLSEYKHFFKGKEMHGKIEVLQKMIMELGLNNALRKMDFFLYQYQIEGREDRFTSFYHRFAKEINDEIDCKKVYFPPIKIEELIKSEVEK